jgi:O-antigen/teichoic acid export membrane protein
LRDSIESILTRSISIGAKFLLLGYLAKTMTLQSYGSFQLVNYFVLISTTLFGLEYYNISNRKIANDPTNVNVYIEHLQFTNRLLPIIIFLQILLFIALFPKELISFSNICLVLLIGFFDYVSQEVYRYLMIAKKYRKGNLQLIYKSSIFLILILFYVFLNNTIDFKDLLWVMVIAYGILLILAGIGFTNNLYFFQLENFKSLKWSEVEKYFKVLGPFILLVFFLKGIEFSDKFILSKKLGLKEAGIYSFVFAISSVINVFVVSGFYIIYLPKLITAFAKNKLDFKGIMFKFALLITGSSLILAVVIIMCAPFIFQFTNKLEFLNHMDLLYILLLGFVFNNMSLIPHIFLYICHEEKTIMKIMGFSFLFNIVLNLVLIPLFGINGAGYSFLLTYIFIFLVKTINGFIKWKKIVA